MRLRPRHVLLSLVAAGSAVAVGLAARSGRDGKRRPGSASGATLRAKVVAEPPDGATVVPAAAALDDLPVARALVEWAARTDARDEWVGDVVEGRAGRRVVESLDRELPHYRAPDRADAEHDGVYLSQDGRVVVLTAAGWSVAPGVR